MVSLKLFNDGRASTFNSQQRFVDQDVYLGYMDDARVEGDPSKLVTKEWDGLRDRYVTAALCARSVVDVCFTSPMTFFTHSSSVKRPQLRTIMDCAENWLDTLDSLDVIGMAKPPALQGIASNSDNIARAGRRRACIVGHN
jgi:hypothetical protein